MATFFGDLGKKYRDLLQPKSKIFDVERAEIAVKTSSTDPKIALETSSKFADDGVQNKIIEKVTFPKYGTAKLTLTDGAAPVTLELESNKLLSDRLKLKAKSVGPAESGDVNAKFDYEPVAVSVDLKYAGQKKHNDVTIIPGFAFTKDKLSAGAELVLKPQADAAVESVSVAAQYGANDWTATARFNQSLGGKNSAQSVLLNGVYNVNSKAQLGVEVGAPLDKLDDVRATVGGRYEFDHRLAVLGKVNQAGTINAAVTHDVSRDIQVALVSTFDAKSGKPESTGVKITLGEY